MKLHLQQHRYGLAFLSPTSQDMVYATSFCPPFKNWIHARCYLFLTLNLYQTRYSVAIRPADCI